MSYKCVLNLCLPIDTIFLKWFYIFMTKNKLPKEKLEINEQKEPVVKKDLKTIINEIFRFVSVGGDFV